MVDSQIALNKSQIILKLTALGATSGRLRSVLLWQSLAIVAAGAVPGIAGAVVSGRFLESLITGMKPVNVSTCVASLLFVVAVAAIGVWAASRRVAHLDIMEVLRAE